MDRTYFLGKKLTARKFCNLAMLTAITAVLAIFCTFRIGTAIKIPLKFISVFITGAVMGPLCGGLSAALGDIINVALVPSGPWLVPLTAIEFLSGVVYGLFFHMRPFSGKNYFLRVGLCALVQFVIDMCFTSLILMFFGYFPSIAVAFSVRIIPGIIKMVLQAAVMAMGAKYLGKFKAVIRL